MLLSRNLASFITAFCVSTCAWAGSFDGNWLKGLLEKNENNTDVLNAIYGLGYVIGVYDAHSGLGFFCPPDGIKVGQIASMTLKILRERPESLHQSADRFVTAALRRAWPCPEQPQGMDATPSIPAPAAPSQKSAPAKSKPKAETSPF